MSGKLLSAERLALIRADEGRAMWTVSDRDELLAHIDAIEAENARLRSEIDAIRRTHTGGYVLRAALEKP